MVWSSPVQQFNITNLETLPQMHLAITADMEKTIKVWNCHDRDPLATCTMAHICFSLKAFLTKDGPFLMVSEPHTWSGCTKWNSCCCFEGIEVLSLSHRNLSSTLGVGHKIPMIFDHKNLHSILTFDLPHVYFSSHNSMGKIKSLNYVVSMSLLWSVHCCPWTWAGTVEGKIWI